MNRSLYETIWICLYTTVAISLAEDPARPLCRHKIQCGHLLKLGHFFLQGIFRNDTILDHGYRRVKPKPLSPGIMKLVFLRMKALIGAFLQLGLRLQSKFFPKLIFPSYPYQESKISISDLCSLVHTQVLCQAMDLIK